MNNTKDFLDQFVLEFTSETIPHTILGRTFVQIPEELLEYQNKISYDLFTCGLFLGEKKREFTPSSSLLNIISTKTNRKVFVNEKTAWLFLCGRDIFGDGIVKANVTSGMVLIQNERDENLGYGIIVDVLSKKNKVVIQNKFDKGDFLRREHSGKKKPVGKEKRQG